MTKEEFLEFCKAELEQRGFIKAKNMFYLKGEKDVLAGIWLQRSDYGPAYYINYYLFIGKRELKYKKDYPVRYDFDIRGRILLMSKSRTKDEEPYLTVMVDYEDYTEEDIKPYLAKCLEREVLPAVEHGLPFIMDNMGNSERGKLYEVRALKIDTKKKLFGGNYEEKVQEMLNRD